MRVIAGKARRLNLETLPGLDTRPTTDRIKETLFNILQADIPGASFLDLFAGSGAIGIEALSRGAENAVFVDKNPKACACIRRNLEFTRLPGGSVLNMDVIQALRSLEGRAVFDCVFMDPPYDHEHEKKVLQMLADGVLLKDDTWIITEASIETDFSYVEDLGYEIVKDKKYKTNRHLILRPAVKE